MSRLGLVIFGATGFTGQKAVEEIVRISKNSQLTWGVAGRSQKKLEELMRYTEKITGEDLSNIKVIIADVDNQQSLTEMTSQAEVIVNCCGPYRLYGEPVIRACLATKTHHVDVSGEPQFMESIQLNYDTEAREAGIFIISACGFDSIPNDMGVVLLQENFRGTLNSVESYHSTELPPEHMWAAFTGGTIHYGTWESLIYSLAHSNELAPLRKQIYTEPPPSLRPKLQARPVFHRRNSNWCLPFPGADNSVVYRTQRHRHRTGKGRPAQFRAYVQIGWLAASALTLLTCAWIFLLGQWKVSRGWLLNWPRFFSWGMVTRDGPRKEVMENTRFEFELWGSGWGQDDDLSTEPNRKLGVKVRGVNPGYGATVTALLFSAITLLRERQLIRCSGGVLTPGAAFKDTNLIKNLNENNLTFEIIRD